MRTLLRVLLLTCLINGLFVPTGASAQQDQPAGPAGQDSPAEELLAPLLRTGHLTLVGLDFHPSRSDLTYHSINGGIYPLNLIPGFGFLAPLHLPRSAVLTRIDFFFVDNDSASNLSFELREFIPEADTTATLFNSNTAGFAATSAIQPLSIEFSPGLSINTQRAYSLRVAFGKDGGAQVLYGLRLTYTTPFLLPPSPEYITIAGSDFTPARSSIAYESSGQHLYTSSAPALFTARLDLPHGAQIDQVEYYVVDNADEKIQLIIFEKDPNLPAWQFISPTDTSGLPKEGSVKKVTVSGSPIFTADNHTRDYLLGVLLANNTTAHSIVGARVRYTPSPANQGMQVKTYAGLNFRPTGSSLTYHNVDGSIYATAPASGRSFQVNLKLPDGVMVHSVTFYVTDLSSASNLSVSGRTYLPESGFFANPFTGDTSAIPALAGIHTITFNWQAGLKSVFHAAKDSFRLRVEPPVAGENLKLHGARVEYFYPKFVFLPVIIR